MPQNNPKPPVADRRPTSTTYHGVRVREDYRWLEDGKDEGVRRWSRRQNRYTRGVLDAIPGRAAAARRFRALFRKGYVLYMHPKFAGGRLFAQQFDLRRGRPVLVVFDSLSHLDHPRVLLDPSQWDRKGSPAVIDLFAPSWDGCHVAITASLGGSEEGDLQVFDVGSGLPTGDVVRHVARVGAGADMAWTASGEGLYYTRHPHPGERPPKDLDFYQQVYFHRLGTPEGEDTYVIGEEFPRIAEVKISTLPDREACVFSVAHGDGGDYEFWAGDGHHPWVRIAGTKDKVAGATLGPDGSVFLVSRQGAPHGKVLELPLDGKTVSSARTVVAEGDWIIEHVAATPHYLFLREQLGGVGRLRTLDVRSGRSVTAKVPPVSAVTWVASLDGDRVLFEVSSFLAPPSQFAWDPSLGPPLETALSSRPLADLSRYEVVREFAVSRDGTRVPLSIVRRKGLKRNGRHPVLLTGYGGYGISSMPQYVIWHLPWIEAGGLLVTANIRGGGEYR